jgi:hypothetical protein
LLLEIQTNCKNWVWTEKNQLSPWCVHTLANDPQASLVSMKEGCLFVLFVTLRSPKQECLLSHSLVQLESPLNELIS